MIYEHDQSQPRRRRATGSIRLDCVIGFDQLRSLPMNLSPWRFFLVAMAGWMNRQQQEAIA
jgi:hypothetical protein